MVEESLFEHRFWLQILGGPQEMDREECYYLRKLAQTGDIPAPDCDPAAPRTEH